MRTGSTRGITYGGCARAGRITRGGSYELPAASYQLPVASLQSTVRGIEGERTIDDLEHWALTTHHRPLTNVLEIVFEVVFDGVGGGLGAVPHIQLGENAAHVVADGAFAQEQHLCDLPVGTTLGDQLEYVHLLLS